MKSIIEQIYYGELSPCSLPTPTCEKYIKSRDAVERIRESILQKYPDCKDLLEEYTLPPRARAYRTLQQDSGSEPNS